MMAGRSLLLTILATVLLALPGRLPPAMAGFDTAGFDAAQFDTGGFGTVPVPAPVLPPEPSPLTLDWTLGTKASLAMGSSLQWVDTHVWLKGRAEALTQGGWFFLAEGRVLALFKTDHRARDEDLALAWRPKQAYVQAGSGDFTWTLGYQILVWGEANSAAVTDVAAPRDQEDLMFKEVEEMRFGQWAFTGEVFKDWGALQLFASPWAETDRMPGFGNRYETVLPGNPRVEDQPPEFGQGEAGFRFSTTRGKFEWALMGGWFRANGPVLEGSTLVRARYPGFAMAGGAASWVRGNVLVKAEAAFKAGHPLQGMLKTGYDIGKKDLVDGMVGLEYTTNDQTKATLELSHRRIFSDTTGLVPAHRDRTALYFTLGKAVLHETLELEYQFFYHLRDRDICHGFKADYEMTDQLTLRGRLHLLQAGGTTTPLGSHDREDRVSVELVYTL